jgi:hypothetical protein
MKQKNNRKRVACCTEGKHVGQNSRILYKSTSDHWTAECIRRSTIEWKYVGYENNNIGQDKGISLTETLSRGKQNID